MNKNVRYQVTLRETLMAVREEAEHQPAPNRANWVRKMFSGFTGTVSDEGDREYLPRDCELTMIPSVVVEHPVPLKVVKLRRKPASTGPTTEIIREN
jgi:hypothetical protein